MSEASDGCVPFHPSARWRSVSDPFEDQWFGCVAVEKRIEDR